MPAASPSSPASSSRGAFLVAAGILASRLMGLVRERVFAHYFGNSIPAAAYRAATRIPNVLATLFGEGVLSASFIPVYAALIGREKSEEADRVASAVFGLLALVLAFFVAAGMLATPLLVDLIAPGFEGEARALAIELIRIMFPGIGFLVLSAWCLGILNSHRKFFLSYVAPVVWNLAIIAALVIWGGRTELAQLAEYVAYATVAGALLQFLVQLKPVLAVLGRFRPRLRTGDPAVRTVIKNFIPVVIGRGVVQISAYVDTAYASLISARALSALSYAQILYLLPVSLFGMSVSAAELPEMSRLEGEGAEAAAKLRARLESGLRRINFFVVPSMIALFILGDVTGAALFETGKFGPADSRYLWYLLAGASIGLVATTTGRLYSSTFYALKDTRTPLYCAIVRVSTAAGLAYLAALRLPAWLGLPAELGAAGIPAMSGLGAWIEKTLLARALAKKIGVARPDRRAIAAMYFAGLVAAAAAIGLKIFLASWFGRNATAEWGGQYLPQPSLHPIITAVLVLGVFGTMYFAITGALRVPEARAVLKKARLVRS